MNLKISQRKIKKNKKILKVSYNYSYTCIYILKVTGKISHFDPKQSQGSAKS